MATRWILGLLSIGGAILAAVWWFDRSASRRSSPDGPRDARQEGASGAAGSLLELERPSIEPVPQRATDAALGTPTGDEAAEPPTSVLSPTYTLRGRVGDAQGNPVAGGSVWLRGRTGDAVSADVAESSYAIDGLAPGRWWLSARAHQHSNVHEVLDLVGEPCERELDLVLRAQQVVTVQVVPAVGSSFADLAGIQIAAIASRRSVGESFEEEQDGEPLAAIRGEVRGLTEDTFIGGLAFDGTLPVHVTLLLGTLVLAEELATVGTENVRFVLDAEEVLASLCTLRFRALDWTGAVLTKANVIVIHEQPGDGVTAVGGIPPSGEFSLTKLAPGPYRLLLGAQGHAALDRALVLRPGDNDLGELRLERAVGIRGVVLAPSGEPLLGEGDGPFHRHVGLYYGRIDPADERPRIAENLVLGVHPDGTFSFQREPGKYLVRAEGKDWISGNLVFDLEGAPPAYLEVHVVPPTPLILFPESGAWTGFSFEIVDASGYLIRAGTLASTAPQRIGLPPGAYRLLLLDAEGQPGHEQPFLVGAAESTLRL